MSVTVPVLLAAGKSEAVRVLVEEGKARIDARDTQGSTPLLVAVVCDQGNIALYLASKGADVEVGWLSVPSCSTSVSMQT
jgi:ankyrin repeat protein